ncbi:PTS sugar transporter subunit IIB [Enterocloster bolteae]|uniref:PTS sugar transporter subunit IIB n=1 Tax=Enterocloster bolteae TaxID=208479 RepID=UPI002675061A|nr:PTS sugar transporter subunit IIB [Enterocloster bolteae]
MKNIVLTRIDDRLIHGQVVTAWIKQYPINKILIIDDELSQNRLMERIYKAAAPMGVEVLIQSVSEAREFLKEEPVKGENFLILVKVPEIIESLLKEGIEIKKVILGGMGAKNGRKTFNRNVSASSEEVECFKRIVEEGVEIFYQLVPNDKAVNIRSLF